MIKILSKILISLTLVSFVFVALVGLNAGMTMDSEGNMSDCPFDEGSSSICDMNPFEHIMKWEQIFTASTSSYFEQILGFLLMAGLALTAVFVFCNINSIYYTKENPEDYIEPPNIIINNILLNISKGILQPRL